MAVRLIALALCCVPASAVVLWDAEGPYAESYLAGRYVEAIEQVSAAIGTSPGLASALWRADRAELYFLVGRYDEAIGEMESAVRQLYEPAFTARLAEFFAATGKAEESRQVAEMARMQTSSRYRQEFPRENFIALARLARQDGENPRRVLQIFQERLLGPHPDFAPGFEAAGEIALEGYGYDVAENYFLKALAIDETRQPALAGLAATYFLAGDPRFEEIRARLEALNPNHPRLQCLVIEQRLAAGDAPGAATAIDALLAINPLHHEGLAYLAASAFLDDDTVQQEAILKKLGELKPGSADGHRIVAEVAARRYRFAEAVALLRAGLALEPEDRRARAALGLNLLRLGEDNTGRVILEEVFAEDAFNVQVYNMLEVMDSIDDFATLSTPEFNVRLPAPESTVMGENVQKLLAEALARYEGEYAVSVKRPVAVQLFDDHDEFMVRSVGLPGNPGHLGICFGNLVTLDSPRARPPGTMNWRSVLWHEFVHVITLQKTGNRIPRWLSEGISVYEETQRDPGWGQPLDPQYRDLIEPGTWPGVAALEDYFIRPASPLHLMFGYYVAGEFVTTYVNAYGKGALVASLEAMGAGEEALKALQLAAGVDGAALDQLLAAHLATVTAPFQNLDPVATPEGPTPEPGPLNRALEDAARAREAGDTEQARALLESAAALYPDFPGERNPLRQLVQLEASTGDTARWLAAVRRLQQHDPLAFEETRALLEVLHGRADWPAVLELSDWCLGIHPFDIDVQTWRRDALRAKGDQPGTLASLDRLAALAPERKTDFSLEKAQLLRSIARDDEARRIVLEILEQYPAFSEAQGLLLEIHGEGKGDPHVP